MKRYKFSQVADYKDIDTSIGEPIIVEKPAKENNEVFRMIYAPDSLTGRPRSDLGTYLGDNTSPVVRDFIERQLRTDFSGNVSSVPDGISDADIAYLTKDKNETVSDYQNRVQKYMMRQKVAVKRASDIARRNALKKKVEVKSNEK